MRVLFAIIVVPCLCAFTFRDAVQSLNHHHAPAALQAAAAAKQHAATKSGAWREPQFKFSAKNMSQAWFTGKKTPMSGFEFSLAQTIPLTSRYTYMRAATLSQQLSLQQQAADQQRLLLRKLWQILITQRKLLAKQKILQENRTWLRKTLNVAEKLYTNGKATRRDILDIQIREAEITTALSNTHHTHQEQQAMLAYLVGKKATVVPDSIPWPLLDTIDEGQRDYRQQALQHKLEAATQQAHARRLARVPDVMLAFGYRPNFDGQGNFFSLHVTVPLPVTASRRAEQLRSLQAQQQVTLQLAEYQAFKHSELQVLRQRLAKLKAELNILNKGIKQFATDARRLAFTSYRLGKATYAELLQAELKLQKILLQQIALTAQLANTHLQYRYLNGAQLHHD